jgi:hypothetical protein
VSLTAWQPIETAPKDNPNRDIEVLLPDCTTKVVHWAQHAPEDHPPIDPGWYFETPSMFVPLPVHPTHWRPVEPRP